MRLALLLSHLIEFNASSDSSNAPSILKFDRHFERQQRNYLNNKIFPIIIWSTMKGFFCKIQHKTVKHESLEQMHPLLQIIEISIFISNPFWATFRDFIQVSLMVYSVKIFVSFQILFFFFSDPFWPASVARKVNFRCRSLLSLHHIFYKFLILCAASIWMAMLGQQRNGVVYLVAFRKHRIHCRKGLTILPFVDRSSQTLISIVRKFCEGCESKLENLLQLLWIETYFLVNI